MSALLRSDAFARFARPAEALDRLERDLVELGYEAERAAEALRMGAEGWGVQVEATSAGLAFAVEGDAPSTIRSLKEMVVLRLEAMAPDEAARLRWSGQAEPGAHPADLRRLTLKRRETLMEGFDRCVFEADDVSAYLGPAMHVRLLVPQGDGREAEWPRLKPNGGTAWPAGEAALTHRVYTIRRAREASREVEIDVVTHGDCTLAGWAARAEPGFVLGALGPAGGPPEADRPLVAAADLCALPALARILEAAPERRGRCVVAAPEEAADYLAVPKGATLELLPPETSAEALAERFLSGGETDARWWFAAEAAGARAARAGLEARGIAKEDRLCVGYWRAG